MAQPTNAAPANSTPTAGPAAAAGPQPGTAAANSQPKTPAGKEAAAAAEIRKLKLKLEGQDVELPESEVIALAQQGKVAGKRFQEAAALKKQADEIMKFAKENPKEFFKRTGMNAREWAEQYLMEELRYEQMSPEQQKAVENEKKLKAYEDEKKQAEEKKRADEMAELQKTHMERLDKMFVEALNKSGLPRTSYTIKRMAELQLVNVQKKLELAPEQLAKIVREDYIAEQKALYGNLEGDQLLDLLGPEVVKKLSKAQIAKLKSKSAPGGTGAPAQRQSNQPSGMTWREYQRRNRRLP